MPVPAPSATPAQQEAAGTEGVGRGPGAAAQLAVGAAAEVGARAAAGAAVGAVWNFALSIAYTWRTEK